MSVSIPKYEWLLIGSLEVLAQLMAEVCGARHVRLKLQCPLVFDLRDVAETCWSLFPRLSLHMCRYGVV